MSVAYAVFIMFADYFYLEIKSSLARHLLGSSFGECLTKFVPFYLIEVGVCHSRGQAFASRKMVEAQGVHFGQTLFN